jgi:signal transduction histidine kinase
MARIVAEAVQRLSYLIEQYQARIKIAEVWPVALGHSLWVEEIWVNYLSNAIKYGGCPPQIQLGATERSNGTVRFWVRDNGPGLSPEAQARLFAPFTQVTQAHTQGYGLGLSIVKRIVDKLGGEVGVESEGIPGKGSLFTFTLPASGSPKYLDS